MPLSYRKFGGNFDGNREVTGAAAVEMGRAMLACSAAMHAKPQRWPYKLRDGRGLCLLVKPTGARWWRSGYRRPSTGRRNTLSPRTFLGVALKKGRNRRNEARRLRGDGIGPGKHRKAEAQAAAETFATVAHERIAKHAPTRAPGHWEIEGRGVKSARVRVPFRATDRLRPDDLRASGAEVMAVGDTRALPLALREAADVLGMAKPARRTGLNRDAL